MAKGSKKRTREPASPAVEAGREAYRLLRLGYLAAEVRQWLLVNYDPATAADAWGRVRAELRGDAIEVYRSVLTDKKATPADRLRAQQRLDRLLAEVVTPPPPWAVRLLELGEMWLRTQVAAAAAQAPADTGGQQWQQN